MEGGRLVVDCTGEGVWFTEADADVRLADLEAAGLRPPFSYIDQLLADVEGSSGMTSCPLLLYPGTQWYHELQVTRLLCGGFVLALRFNHTIMDANGQAQFMSAVAELARGLPSPTISPAWSRELLRFHPHEVAAIRTRLPPRLRNAATTFEALTAALWRARVRRPCRLYGWGEPVYGGRADARHVVSFLFTVKDSCCGKNVVAMTIVLPPPAMDRFASEVNMLLTTTPSPIAHQASSPVPQARL
ncbi:hypothetical protein PR202_ga06889 [Eleusine coracana subsp. coracana]|uniref:Benzyl alcohol O-benzoyltransferase n=1 Tax=Eleusine coracana subsp. coracana TaxID=191504 RepID=A0AAV5BY82_ELECO|nr:hypothetical protein PR202_ga06889 [Eleusine coracana subsp. coracana]